MRPRYSFPNRHVIAHPPSRVAVDRLPLAGHRAAPRRAAERGPLNPMPYIHYIPYKDREYGVYAIQRADQRWDAFYELSGLRTRPTQRRRFQVASLFGFDSQLAALRDAERNARADIDHGIGRPGGLLV